MHHRIYSGKIWLVVYIVLFIHLGWRIDLHAAGLSLTWTDNSNNEDGFRIERLAGGLLDTTHTVGANVTSYSDSGLQAGVVYCYRVKAFNSGGESAASNQACGTAKESSVALSVSPASASPGGTVSVSWSGITAATSTDWIGLYAPGADNTAYINWIYVSCSTNAGSARASGSCSYPVPATIAAGNYELRLFANNGYTRLAAASLTLTTGSGTTPPPSGTSPALTRSPSTVSAGGSLTVSWSGVTSPTPTDWIGLYSPGAAETAYINWIYVSCSTTAGSARASGSCSYPVPATLAAGSYELRLFTNNGYTRLATTNLTVTTGGTGGTSPALTLSASTVNPGGVLTVSWSGITNATPTDWIGLYAPGAANTAYINWIYVSCSTNAGSARASGSCSYPVPSSVSAGNYELRLLSNNGYTRLATSGTLSVSNSSVAAFSAASDSASEATIDSSLTSMGWNDYELSLKMRSSGSNSMGVIFRYQDDRNHYRFLWSRNPASRRVEKVQNGTTTVLMTDATGYVANRTYEVKISLQGATMEILVDGSRVFAITDSSFAGGSVGLYTANNPGTSFDDIAVSDLTTGATLLTEDFSGGSFAGWTVIDRRTNATTSAWAVSSGALLQNSSSTETFAVYNFRKWADYRLALRIQSLDRDSIGVMFRYQDNKNYYRFSWNSQNSFRRLEKIHNGTMTVLAEDLTGYTTGQPYLLQISADGPSLQVVIDDNLVFSVTDPSLATGSVALYSSGNQGSTFDDILIEDLASGAILLSDDFSTATFNGWTLVDELGASQGPSAWSAQSGALVQSSNMGSNTGSFPGTYAVY